MPKRTLPGSFSPPSHPQFSLDKEQDGETKLTSFAETGKQPPTNSKFWHGKSQAFVNKLRPKGNGSQLKDAPTPKTEPVHDAVGSNVSSRVGTTANQKKSLVATQSIDSSSECSDCNSGDEDNNEPSDHLLTNSIQQLDLKGPPRPPEVEEFCDDLLDEEVRHFYDDFKQQFEKNSEQAIPVNNTSVDKSKHQQQHTSVIGHIIDEFLGGVAKESVGICYKYIREAQEKTLQQQRMEEFFNVPTDSNHFATQEVGSDEEDDRKPSALPKKSP